MSNIYKFLTLVFTFCVISKSFSQDVTDYNQSIIKDEKNYTEILDPLFIGNFLSSIIASKNGDYKNFLFFSEKALKTRKNDLELLENAFWANIYLGNVNRALTIVSNIELLTDEYDQQFLYPTIVELIRRNELSSATEISNLLGIEEHDIFIKNMIQIWDHVQKNQKANALSKLKNYTKSTKKDSDIYFFLKVQSFVIFAYFDEYKEIISVYEELKQKINIIPSRFYIAIAKIIHDKIDSEKAKVFLNENLPKNLDLELTINNLKNNETNELSHILSNVFYECGYLVAKSEGLLKSIPHFWFSIHLNNNNQNSRLVLSSFFSEINQNDLALEILNKNKIKSPSWIISEFEKSYLLEKKGDYKLAISIIEKLSSMNEFKDKALLRISNIHRRNDDFTKSIEILNKIDLSRKEHPEVYYYKSLNLVLLKDWENAIKSFDILLKKYPKNPEISNFVGYTLVDRNIRLKEGIELIKYAVSQEPQNGFYLDSLGWAYYKLDELKKAIVYLERAIELEPQEMEINDHLGDAYFRTGRHEEAKLVWERALSLRGDRILVEEIRKKLEKNFNYKK